MHELPPTNTDLNCLEDSLEHGKTHGETWDSNIDGNLRSERRRLLEYRQGLSCESLGATSAIIGLPRQLQLLHEAWHHRGVWIRGVI